MNKEQELELYQSIEISEINNSYETENEIIESYELFNNSLEYVKNGSEDIALICLKKAVAANKGFLEAYNLMTLICLLGGNIDGANKYSNIVLKYDESNDKALRYLQYIYDSKPEINKVKSSSTKKNPETSGHENDIKNSSSTKEKYKNDSAGKNNVKKVASSQSKNGSYMSSKPKVEHSKSKQNLAKKNKYKKLLSRKYRFNVLAYSCILVAIILTVFSILFSLIGNLSGNKHKADKHAVSIKSNQAKHSSKKTVKNNNTNKSVANNEAGVSQGENANLTPKPTSTPDGVAALLNTANNKFNSKDYAGAEDAVKSIDKTKLTKAEQTQYQNLSNKLYQADGMSSYQKGYMYFNKLDFATAVPYLERYLAFAKNDQYRMWAVYYTAKSYYNLGNKQKVDQYIAIIRKEYPNSEVAGYINSWKQLK